MYSEEGCNTWNDRGREHGIKLKNVCIFQQIPPFIQKAYIKHDIWDVLLDTVY